jgi:hypothetical protein
MSIITIILFFLYFFGFGYSVTYLLKLKETPDFWERNIMRIAFGFVTFIVLGTILNFLRVPFYWWIYLILALIIPLFSIFKRKIDFSNMYFNKSKLKLTKKNVIYIILLILFLFNLFVYVKGSFAYEYLEDDDPWTYARDMKYVATEHTLNYEYFRPVAYLDPYPPAYVMTLGLLHQTSPNTQWTLKFFNSLLVSLSIVFFFFMVKQLTKNNSIALASTFVLSMVPAYLSHFIWAHAIIPMLFFILIYSYVNTGIIKEKKWWVITVIASTAIFLSHTRQVIKLAIMVVLFFIAIWAYSKKFPKELIISSILGFIISLVWWIPKFPWLMKLYITEEKVAQMGLSVSATQGFLGTITKILGYIPRVLSAGGGTGTRPYTFSDFFIATKTNMINNPIGFGFFVSILTILTIIFVLFKYKALLKKRNYWLTIILLWFLFTFLFVNSETFKLPFGFGAWRMWMLLAIPVSILCGYGIILLTGMFKRNKLLQIIVLIIIVTGIFATGGYYKYYHNTNENWPAGGKWTSGEEIQGYIWMKNNLPLNSNVFTYSSQNKVVFGYNMFACVWCEEYRDFHPDVLNESLDEVYNWLKQNDYEYLAFGGMEFKYLGRIYGEEEATKQINLVLTGISQSPQKFQLIHQNAGFILFKII